MKKLIKFVLIVVTVIQILFVVNNDLRALDLNNTFKQFQQKSSSRIKEEKPKKEEKESYQETEIFGSRGCPTDEKGKVFIFVPTEKEAVTIADRPTFLLFFEKIPLNPLIVSITEPQVSEPVYLQSLKIEKAGFVPVSIPEEVKLVFGKSYVFTVAVVCNQQRFSENKFKRIVLQKVNPTPTLTEQLKSQNNDLNRAIVLAKANIGYDAIASAYKAYSQLPSFEEQNTMLFRQILVEVKSEADSQSKISF